MKCPMKFKSPFDDSCDPECAWLLSKDGNLFCAISWFCRKQLHDGRGLGSKESEHAFAPWIVNTANGGDAK